MKRAINIPFTESQFNRVNALAEKKRVGKATVLRMLLEEGMPEFERASAGGIFIPYEKPEKLERYVQVYLEEDTKEKLEGFSEKTKMSVRMLSRQIIIPRMAEGR